MAIDFKNKIYILDGGMGTMMQKLGMRSDETSTLFSLREPEILKSIHKQYIEAGSNIIYAANGSNVDTTICNGQILMENKELTTLDEQEIYQKAREAIDQLKKAI